MPVQLALLALRALLAHRVVLPARPARRGRLRVQLARQGRMDILVVQARPVQPAPRGTQVQLAPLACKEELAQPAPRGTQVQLAPLAIPVRSERVRRVLVALHRTPARLVRLVKVGRLALHPIPARPARRVRLAHKEHKATLARPALWVRLAHQAR